MEGEKKGCVCVTGGTGYVASWLIMRLLQYGYSVNTTIRFNQGFKKDISFLTNLPGASERLQIFNADLENPESFDPAIKGCNGVFHVAHIVDFEKETSETQAERSIKATLRILEACVHSKTVKRVVYTSCGCATAYNGKGLEVVDESSWSDIDFIKYVKPLGASYYISKTLSEKVALEFAERNGLDIVTILPAYIHGPFSGPHCPDSVRMSLAMIFGHEEAYEFLINTPLVHVEDAISAYIFLLEYPKAQGRYLCSATEISIIKMSEFLSARYPQYQIPPPNSLKGIKGFKYSSFSSKKLLDTGFTYKYGIEEMYDEAIQCCKQNGVL